MDRGKPRLHAGGRSGDAYEGSVLPGLDRRRFISVSASALLGTAAGLNLAACQGEARQSTDDVEGEEGEGGFSQWGWPLPYEQISDSSRKWLENKGWWPLQGGWIVAWSGEELVGSIMQNEELLQRRGIEAEWQTFSAAGYSNEAFAPGRLQLANTGALGVLSLAATGVPITALAVHSPGITHAALVHADSPLNSLADLKDQRILGKPAVVATTTGSTNHFGFIAAAAHLGLKQGSDYTLRSLEPADIASAPKGIDVFTNWQPHVENSVKLAGTRVLEPLDKYYVYSGYCYCRRELDENTPDVVQAITDAFMEAVLWGRLNQDEAVESLLSMSDYAGADEDIIRRMSNEYFFWPKPTVYYPFNEPNGLWPKEESRLSSWAYETDAVKKKLGVQDWQSLRRTGYMDKTFKRLGWKIPETPPFLPKDFPGVGNLPYPRYSAALLDGPATFPDSGDLTKPWRFNGKRYRGPNTDQDG